MKDRIHEEAVAVVQNGAVPMERAQAVQIVHYLSVDGLLAPAPQVIRTPAELEALDPDTVVLDGIGETYPVRAFLDADEYEKQIFERYLPAVVVRDGAGVRACREALEGETGQEDDI